LVAGFCVHKLGVLLRERLWSEMAMRLEIKSELVHNREIKYGLKAFGYNFGR